jgi:hypothetical protein
MQAVKGTPMADSQPSLPDGMYAEWRGTVYPARGTVRPPKSVRLVAKAAEEGFDEVAPGQFRRAVPMSELTALFELQTYCTWMGIRCMVTGSKDDGRTLFIHWVGGNQTRAKELGFESMERGIYSRAVPQTEVSDLHQEHHEIPLP